jgi:hypothetical protein
MTCSSCKKERDFSEFRRGRVCLQCLAKQRRASRKRKKVKSGPRKVALSRIVDSSGKVHVNWGYTMAED